MSKSSTDHMCLICGSALVDAMKVPDRVLSPNLLGSNRQATKSEEVLICEEVETCDSRAIRLEADINRTQTFLQRLINKQRRVKQRSQQLRAVLSPMRVLPNNLIQEIIMHLVGPDVSVEDILLPGHISRQWRQVALKIPRLWSHFSFDPDSHRVDMDLAKMKISRIASGDMTVDVKCPGSHSQYGSAFLKLVIPYGMQWQELCLQVPADLLKALKKAKCRPPNLNLVVLDCKFINKNVAPTIASILSKSSRLRSVTITNALLESMPLPKSYKYLESLTLSQVDLNIAVDILSNTPSLDTCRMSISAKITRKPSSTIHPSLRTFHVAHTIGCDSIIDRVTLPAVEELRYRVSKSTSIGTETTWDHSNLENFIQRSSPRNLFALSLEYCDVDVTDKSLTGIIRLRPCLAIESLSVTLGGRADQAPSALGWLGSKGLSDVDALLPNLRSLTINYLMMKTQSSPNISALAEMIRSRLYRSKPGAKGFQSDFLQSVVISIYGTHQTFEEVEREALNDLRSLRDDVPHLKLKLTIDTDRNKYFEVQ